MSSQFDPHSTAPLLASDMADYQQQGYPQQYAPPQGYPPPQGAPYNPGQSAPYAQTYQPPPPQDVYKSEKNGEYERFRPKKRINDPIFLVLFIAQVSEIWYGGA